MYRPVIYLAISICLFVDNGQCEDYPTATAPANMGILEHTPSGVMYVDKDLLAEYKQLKEQAAQLRRQVFREGGLAKAAREHLNAVEQELRALRAKLDEQKVHAEPFGVFTQRTTQSFPLSPSQQIVITTDDVNVRGWNGNNIKCVVDKTILSEEEPEPSEFDAVVVQHEVRLADDLVGMSDDARAASEREFLASEEGKKLDEQARKRRAEFVNKIHNSYGMYKPLQGNEVNVVQIMGLTGQQGNKHQTGRTESAGGGATVGGYWRRSAKVTIYVPQCKHVAIRGCKKAVDIKSIRANLILTTHGSQDISYGSDFAVKDVQGNVVIHQVPIRDLEGVTGDVDIRQTDEYTNTGTSHRAGFRTSSSPPPDPTSMRRIEGALNGRFVRADLHLQDINGTIDVINEYGNTTLTVDQALSDAAHRVLSHSGAVRAIIPKADSAGVSVYAFTQTGTAQVAFDRSQFDDRSFGDGSRSWYGFQTASDDRFGFFAMKRPEAAWENNERGSGLDLISNAGSVIVGPAK